MREIFDRNKATQREDGSIMMSTSTQSQDLLPWVSWGKPYMVLKLRKLEIKTLQTICNLKLKRGRYGQLKQGCIKSMLFQD